MSPRRLALALSGCLALASCGRDVTPPSALAKSEPAPAAKSVFRTEAVAERDVPVNVVTAPGRIELNSNRISRVMPPLSGRVTEVLVRFGDPVRANQPVAILESPDADAAVAAAQQAEASIHQARAAMAKADADLERLRDLYENKAISRKQLLEAENLAVQAEGGVRQAEAAVKQTKRRLEMLDLRPDEFGQKITVRAPIPGKVLEVNVAPGEYRNDPNNPLMTIADLSTVWVAADVPESAIRFVQRGERVEIELTAYPGEQFPGRVTQIADVVDAATRTVRVRAELPNPDGRLRPEMFGQIRHIDSVRRALVAPLPAIVHVHGKSVVFVETAAGSYQQREITTGEPMGQYAPVFSGLEPGDKVVVDGALLLKRN